MKRGGPRSWMLALEVSDWEERKIVRARKLLFFRFNVPLRKRMISLDAVICFFSFLSSLSTVLYTLSGFFST
jgi:hypothetical protein